MALTREELDRLARYFDEVITFSNYIRTQVEEVEAGHAVLYVDVQDFHLNGNGTLHGGVYATLIDNTMALAVTSMSGVRIATTEMNVHFLGPVGGGRITCRGVMVHRTRRTATAEAKVYDDPATSWPWSRAPSASSSSRAIRSFKLSRSPRLARGRSASLVQNRARASPARRVAPSRQRSRYGLVAAVSCGQGRSDAGAAPLRVGQG